MLAILGCGLCVGWSCWTRTEQLTSEHINTLFPTLCLVFGKVTKRHHPPNVLDTKYRAPYSPLHSALACGETQSLTALLCLVMDAKL